MSTQIAPEALPLSTNYSLPTAGLVTVGIGGFGGAVQDRVNSMHAGRPEEAGIFPAIIDKDRSVPGETEGRQFTMARQGDSFFGSDAQLTPEMRRIATGGNSRFALTRAEARVFADGSLEGKAGFGGQPIPSAICADLAFPGWRARLENSIMKAKMLTPPTQDVTVIIIASLYGGTGIGHLAVVIDRILAMPEKVDVVVIVGMPSHAVAVLPADQRGEAIARGLATLRELQMKRISQLFLLGEDNPRLGNQRNSAIEVAALMIDGWAQNGEAFNARRANMLGQDLDDARHGQRNCSIGGAQLLVPASTFARQNSHAIAVDALNRMLDMPAAEQLRASQDGRALLLEDDLLKPLMSVLESTGPISELGLLDAYAGNRYSRLWDASMGIDDGDPQPLDSMDEQLRSQPSKLTRQELVSVANSFTSRALAQEGKSLLGALYHHKDVIRDRVAEQFASQFGRIDGLPISTTPFLFPRMEELLGTCAALCRRAADKLEADLAVQSASDRGPLHDARESLDRAAAALPGELKMRGMFGRTDGASQTYLSAHTAVLQLERHAQALRMLTTHLRDVANLFTRSLTAVKADMAALRSYRTRALAAAEAEAAELSRLDSAAPIRVAPAPGPAREDMRRVVEHHAAGNEDVRDKVLGGLHVRHHHDAGDPGDWTITWEVPAALNGRAAGSSISSVISKTTGLKAAGQKLESFPSATLSVMAHRELAPYYEQFTVFDALALEYRHAAEGHGGQVEPALLEHWLRAQIEDLRELAKPMTSPLDSALDGTDPMPPQRHHMVRVGLRPPSLDIQAAAHGDIPRQVHQLLIQLMGDSVSEGSDHQILFLNVVNRIDVGRLSEVHGRQLSSYLNHSGTPIHLSRAVRRAWELERVADEQGLLRGRMLDPRAVELLEEIEVLGSFLALIATGTMPTDEGSTIGRGASTYQINLNLGRALQDSTAGAAKWRHLGPSSAPALCLDELYGGDESNLLKPAIVASWRQALEKLKSEHGEGVWDHYAEAMGRILLPANRDADARYLADLRLIAAILPRTSFTM